MAIALPAALSESSPVSSIFPILMAIALGMGWRSSVGVWRWLQRPGPLARPSLSYIRSSTVKPGAAPVRTSRLVPRALVFCRCGSPRSRNRGRLPGRAEIGG
ncbi:MAG: hypothetical protein MZV64_04520 [Ignavibacteriales bacterium]|nr:hypothetical protein [Ignavibacteriales bacterium]